MEEFDLQGHEFVELNNLLKLTGICASGGSAKMLIVTGVVNVDGKQELRKRCKIRAGQQVEIEDQKIKVI